MCVNGILHFVQFTENVGEFKTIGRNENSFKSKNITIKNYVQINCPIETASRNGPEKMQANGQNEICIGQIRPIRCADKPQRNKENNILILNIFESNNNHYFSTLKSINSIFFFFLMVFTRTCSSTTSSSTTSSSITQQGFLSNYILEHYTNITLPHQQPDQTRPIPAKIEISHEFYKMLFFTIQQRPRPRPRPSTIATTNSQFSISVNNK